LAKDQAISPSSLPPLPPKSTAMDDNTEKIPIEFNLAQNYPNPFNPKTTVEYSIAKKSLVYLAVFNLKGQMIKILENKIQEKGQYVTFWDGTNKNGQPVSSGVYIIRLQTKNMEKNIKALLIR
jgi:hypothetical protein